ncbi:MAG: hypothetical protein R2787_00200 [Saprospiraceae bacterium]
MAGFAVMGCCGSPMPGNITCTQKITVRDTTNPNFTGFPADVTVECNAVPNPANPVGTDNCDNNVIVTYLGETRANGNCPDNYVLTRTWKAEDNCGNTRTASQKITVRDTSKPTLSNVPANVTVECDAIPAVGNPTASDNCDNSVTISYLGEVRTNGACPDNFTLTRTWKAEDNCGNTTTATQKITVIDSTKPVFTGFPNDVTVECDAVPSVANPTGSDNCDNAVTITYLGENRVDGSCPYNYTLIRRWRVEDNCGNSQTRSQQIVVRDTQKPVFTYCPPDLTVSGTFPPADQPTATDNCGNVTITFQESTPTGCNYVLIRTWTAKDECNNTNTCQQKITVNANLACAAVVTSDYEGNDISIPGGNDGAATVNATGGTTPYTYKWSNGQTTKNATNLAAGTYTVTVTDKYGCTTNCSVTLADPIYDLALRKTTSVITAVKNGDIVPFTITVFNQGTISARDIVVNDYIPAGFQLAAGGSTWVGAGTPGSTVTSAISGPVAPGATATLTINLRVLAIGNEASDYINIAEVKSSKFLNGVDATNADKDSQADSNATNDGGGLVDSPADDAINGDGTGAPNTGNAATDEDDSDPSTVPVFDLALRKTTAVTSPVKLGDVVPFTIEVFNQGNLAATQVVVNDYIPAGFELAAGGSTWTGAGTPGSTVTTTIAGPIAPGASATVTINLKVVSAGNEASDYINRSEIKSAKDGNGVDRTNDDRDSKPDSDATNDGGGLVDSPADDAINGDGTGAPNTGNAATDEDDSDPETVPVFDLALRKTTTQVDTVSVGDIVKFTIEVFNQGNQNVLDVVIIDHIPSDFSLDPSSTGWSVVGLTARTTISEILPGTSVTRDIFLKVKPGVSACELLNISEILSFKDKNGVDQSTKDKDSTPDGNPSNDAGGLVDSASDNAIDGDGTGLPGGNSAGSDEDDQDPARVPVCDVIPPMLTGIPMDIYLSCDQPIPAPPAIGVQIMATDNCDEDVDISFMEESDKSMDPNNCKSNQYIIKRKWVAIDNCGNVTTAEQWIYVTDEQPPSFTLVPANVTVECDQVPGLPIIGVEIKATDNCDPDVTITFEKEDKLDGICPDSYTLVRTWKAVDNCGNSKTAKQTISVIDTTPPVFDIKPADVTVECDQVPPPPTVTATDNCDANVTVTYSQVKTDGPCPDSYTLTRTWVAIDNCGNASTHVQKVKVQDTTAPVFDQPLPVDVTVECDAVPAPPTVTAKDNCDANVTVTYNQVKTDGSCPHSYTLTRTWIAIDNCDNATTHTQKVTVRDTTPPVFDNKPADITVECDDVPGPVTVTAKDNCDLDVEVTYNQVKTDGNCPDSYTLTRTWIALDNCGNASTHVQKVTVGDTTPPVFDNKPVDITVECDNVPAPEVVTAKDNCDQDVEVTYNQVKTDGNCPDSYTLTRTWIAIDNCGNTATHVQKVTVEDTTPPVFDNKPADITVECDNVPGPEVVTAKDNCDQNVDVTYNQVKTDGSCPDDYTLTRTWIAIDNCGNTATYIQKVTVEDTTPPVFDNKPTDITVECDNVPAPEVVTAQDNCDQDVDVTYNQVKTDGSCPDYYTLTRTWIALDNCGNASTHVQKVTVEDTTPPVFDNKPADITVECDNVPVPEVVTATDNCDQDVDVTYNQVKTDGSCPDYYTLTRTWIAIDNCGNAATHVQKVTVQDTTPPVFDNKPADITVECDNVPAPEVVTATDNCDQDVDVTYNQVKTDGSCPDYYTLTRTWIAIDNCGNASTHVQKVTVEDTTPPVFDNKPADITVECDNVPAPEVVTATDNCDLNVDVTYNQVKTDGSCPDYYTLTRTWIAIDNCGNAATHVQKVTVEDTTPPVFDNKPADITVECDNVPAPVVVTATDNCDLNVDVTYNQVKTDGSCPDDYTLTRTWIAIDNCGNAATHVQKVTVQDTTPPVFDNKPADITVECDNVPGPEVVTAADNCDQDVDVTYNEVKTDGNCPDYYTLTRTWIAIDNCGNAATHVQKVTVEDTTAPVLNNKPADITVECDNVPDAEVVTASDNCDNDVVVTYNQVKTDGSCPDDYTLTRTWIASDNCGNTATHVQKVTVEDTTPPVFDNKPADITVECDNVPGPDPVTATDNCDQDVDVTYNQVKTDGSCPDYYTLTRTWIAIDNCGNAATHVQKVTVEDTTPPVFDNKPADITVECDNVPGPDPVTATDNCDQDVDVTYNQVKTDGSCPDYYTLTRTWIAIDNCGNAATHVQKVTVEDTTPPVFDNKPADITVECDNVPAPEVVTATDNCDLNVDVTYNQVKTDGSCPDYYTLTRTWIAIDNCGNAATHVQKVTVEDTTPPVFDNKPADITVECDNVPAPVVVTATDNCDLNVDVTYNQVKTDGSCPDYYT